MYGHSEQRLDGNDGLEALNETGERHCGFLHFPARRAVHSRNTAPSPQDSFIKYQIRSLTTLTETLIFPAAENTFKQGENLIFSQNIFLAFRTDYLFNHYLAKGSARLVSHFVLSFFFFCSIIH